MIPFIVCSRPCSSSYFTCTSPIYHCCESRAIHFIWTQQLGQICNDILPFPPQQNFPIFHTMPSAVVASNLLALKPSLLDVHTVKQCPAEPSTAQPERLPPIRSSAWLKSMIQACKLLGWKEGTARQTYGARNGYSGKLPVRSTEPASSYILAQLVREVYHFEHRPLPDRRSCPLVERTLLELLHVAVSDKLKHKSGMKSLQLYKAGDEKEDAKLVCAAVMTIKSHQLRRQVGDGTTFTRYSPRKPLQHEHEHEHERCIEQTLLKIDKWADAWLTGAIPHTDQAWNSFEFCLCLPDVLEEGEVKE